MGLWGSFKKAVVEICSDDVAPVVCTHCGHYAKYDSPTTVCNNCGARNEIYFVGSLPVCGECGSHSYHLECSKCGRPIRK